MTLALADREICKSAASSPRYINVSIKISSRKHCCHPYDSSDMLSYMSVLIKISNHLLLILPGEHYARSVAISYNLSVTIRSADGYSRTGKRNLVKLIKVVTYT
jgi:hypothetical protein